METARIDMRSEIAGVDFGSKLLDERFKKTMESLSKEPGKSIWLSSDNRSEAKAAYRMNVEIMRQTDERTKRRITESGCEVILAFQGTMGVNYDGHKKTAGMGYSIAQDILFTAKLAGWDGAETDIVTDLERISDHCSNVALYVIETMSEKGDVKFESHQYLRQTRKSEEFLNQFNGYKDKYLTLL